MTVRPLLAALILVAPACSDIPDEFSQPPAETPASESARPVTCTPDEHDAIAAPIRGQLRAFADGDFDAALGYATTEFQAGIDAEAFRRLIEGGYPQLPTARASEIDDCEIVGERAAAVVHVTGADGEQVIAYDLRREGGAWRIAGAVALEDVQERTRTV